MRYRLGDIRLAKQEEPAQVATLPVDKVVEIRQPKPFSSEKKEGGKSFTDRGKKEVEEPSVEAKPEHSPLES